MISTRRVGWMWISTWLTGSAVLTVAQLSGWFGPTEDLPYLAIAAGAPIAAWVGARRLRGNNRLVAQLFAVCVTASAIGDAISIIIGWQTGAEPAASVADVAWLSSYLALGTALLLLLRRGGPERRRDLDGLIDVAAVFVAGMLIIWELAIAATATDSSLPVGHRVLWGSYPVLDIAILALVLRVLMRDRTVASLLVAGAVSLWLASDIAYLAIADAASYAAVLDAGWLWAMILIALAVWYGPGARLSRRRAPRPGTADQVGLTRVLVALLPLLVPSSIELSRWLRGQDTDPVVTMSGTAVLLVLAFFRMARLAWAARSAREALVSQERYASALAANSSDAVAVFDTQLRLANDFPRLAALVGYPGYDVRGLSVLAMVVAEDVEEVRATLRRCFASPGQVFDFELRIHHRQRRRVWLGARAVNLLADPDVRGVVVNLRDISDRKGAEEELAQQAFSDALTGLANRALFRDRLDHALDRSARTGTEPAVVFLDLDGFKTVNDSLGHDSGDDLLREVAARLGAAVRRGDTVGRLGGDEFAILIEQSHHPLDEAIGMADRLLEALRDPVLLGGQSLTISASIGIAVGDTGGGSTSLLRNADVAMYRSKATGKDKWTVYQPGMRTAALVRLELEASMHAALGRGEFRLVYQPMVELRSEHIVGFEALLRWQHPSYGLLTPDRFIPLAEETGLIVPIGRWVLNEATRTAAGWQQRVGDAQELTMAVNLSARQLAAPELVEDVTTALARSGLDPRSLVLEMTETALVRDTASAGRRLRELHRHGVRLAIDDFGTGYSSLSYLRQFPVDILKIDRAFINTITEGAGSPPILRGLLDLGRTLQLEMVAEGVELGIQRNQLREQQCDLAQGFLFGRPVPPAEAEALLTGLPSTTTPDP